FWWWKRIRVGLPDSKDVSLRISENCIPGGLRNSRLGTQYCAAQLLHSGNRLIEGIDVNVVHPTTRLGDWPICQSAGETVCMAWFGLNPPVIDSRRFFQMPPKQGVVEVHQFCGIGGVDFEMCY